MTSPIPHATLRRVSRRPLLLLLAALALTACPAPPVATPSPSASAPPDAATLLPLLHELHQVLLQDHLSIAAVAAHLGTVTSDPGAPLPALIRTRIPGLAGARITEAPRGTVFSVELTFTPEARPTIQQLRGVFGDDRVVLARLHGDRATLFYPLLRGKHWSLVIVAGAARCLDRHNDTEPNVGPCEKLDAGSRIDTLELQRNAEP